MPGSGVAFGLHQVSLVPVTVRETVASYHSRIQTDRRPILPTGSASSSNGISRRVFTFLERYRSSGYGPLRVNGLRGDFSSYSGFSLESLA